MTGEFNAQWDSIAVSPAFARAGPIKSKREWAAEDKAVPPRAIERASPDEIRR